MIVYPTVINAEVSKGEHIVHAGSQVLGFVLCGSENTSIKEIQDMTYPKDPSVFYGHFIVFYDDLRMLSLALYSVPICINIKDIEPSTVGKWMTVSPIFKDKKSIRVEVYPADHKPHPEWALCMIVEGRE